MQPIVGYMGEQAARYPDLSQVFPAPAPQSFHSPEGRAVVESGHREAPETFLALIRVRAAPLDLREVERRTGGLGGGPYIDTGMLVPRGLRRIRTDMDTEFARYRVELGLHGQRKALVEHQELLELDLLKRARTGAEQLAGGREGHLDVSRAREHGRAAD